MIRCKKCLVVWEGREDWRGPTSLVRHGGSDQSAGSGLRGQSCRRLGTGVGHRVYVRTWAMRVGVGRTHHRGVFSSYTILWFRRVFVVYFQAHDVSSTAQGCKCNACNERQYVRFHSICGSTVNCMAFRGAAGRSVSEETR